MSGYYIEYVWQFLFKIFQNYFSCSVYRVVAQLVVIKNAKHPKFCFKDVMNAPIFIYFQLIGAKLFAVPS